MIEIKLEYISNMILKYKHPSFKVKENNENYRFNKVIGFYLGKKRIDILCRDINKLNHLCTQIFDCLGTVTDESDVGIAFKLIKKRYKLEIYFNKDKQ